ncbi:epoxide hydrolase family protein [Novosphingobium pentaromativorans]|uniref:Epoxide hydrolase domain protein n=1 Tax=Novosphingobium pentaromativorans US6-1 TaxID=1088721 RepID=G6E889_9SPHN|nr:epoxide hydrolase family protein [Novosphingobium pentaromativorans]AIT81420.1 epoxide hydrolase [Novosphingobium pentaromativorans US6-1]EHJ62429.1 Epoxide hydrolase domain protein [Novosphingobium pentaromativorans US6-1]
MTTPQVTPFKAHVSDDVINDLKLRLARTRWPDEPEDAGWDYGTNLAYLKELCDYWQDGFDWRKAEARFNAFPQFMTEIDGQNVHFYHIRSPEPDATAMIITHGYPGSVAEFLDIFGPLTDPRAHGGNPKDAFHIVAPSIPGYGFSGPTKGKGFSTRQAARINVRLMEMLGYDRYIAQGGDWGAGISGLVATYVPDRLIGLHLNLMVGAPADPANPADGLTEDDLAYLKWKAAYEENESGYQVIQRTKPQSLAYGLNDSPAGLAAWIVEKFKTWSDCGEDIESSYTKDQLLENIMLYWVTQTINSAMRLYYESLGPGRLVNDIRSISVPVGHARFPAEIRRTPRKWAETICSNIVRWEEQPRGGHFAALEAPDLFIDEIRAFARQLRA